MTQVARSVVIGVDFGQLGDDALMEALKLYRSGWATALHPVHVLDPRDVVDDPLKPALATEEEVLEKAPAALRDRLGTIAAALGLTVPDDIVHPHARLGSAVDALIQVAVDYEADLIVVGTHGRQGLDRMLLGSTAESLVRKASCPVFVARPKDHSRHRKSERPDAPYRPGEEPAYTLPHDHPEYLSSDISGWSPSDNGPTGYRIV